MGMGIGTRFLLSGLLAVRQWGNGWVERRVGGVTPKSPRRDVIRSSSGAGVVCPSFGGHSSYRIRRLTPCKIIILYQKMIPPLICSIPINPYYPPGGATPRVLGRQLPAPPPP